MDPLSIIASIAGIASAGAQLSNTLFKLYKTVKNAPKEIQSVAIEMSGLTSTLEHLRDIIKSGQSYAKPQFCQAVRHVVKNFQMTQQEIDKMAADESMLRRVKWLKAARLLSDIEKHKVTLTLQIAILSAAILVKTANSRLAIHEKVENRFKAQAESLVLAGQASFQNDESEPIPDPPQERAPSPPVRTSKRLPSPVRESEIPGHVRTEELYGQNKNPEDNAFLAASEKEEVHSALALSVKDPVRSERRYTVPAIDDKDEEGISSVDEERVSRHRRRSGFDPLSGHSIAQFGPDFHRRGDAATFLYNLVFLNEIPVREAQGESSHLRGTGSDDQAEERYQHRLSDDLHNEYHDYENNAAPRDRVRFKDPKPQEPGRIVNRLLLAWTSLSESEVEKGKPDNQPDKSRAFGESDSSDSEESLYGPEDPERNWRREARAARNRLLREETRYNDKPEFDPRGRRILRPTQNRDRPFGYTNAPPQNNIPSPVSAEPSMPHPNGGYGQPYGQARNPYAPSYGYSGYANWMPGAPNSSHRYPFSLPDEETYSPPPTQSHNPATETKPVRLKFQKPAFVVLPQTDSADYEAEPINPGLDLVSVSLGIMRQGDEPIWDCDAFMSEKGYPGKAIMGALIGDKSARNPHGLDLAHTLMKGRSLKLVYIRGNDIGETWFMNEQPVFLQFLHSGYLPQFYPAKEADERAMKQEYVAIGEEWASFEALQQLGFAVKRREEGRVLLDPSTTWKHGLEAPSPAETTDSDTRTPPVPDRRARVEDESEVDIIDLPIREEPKKTPEQTIETQSKTNPVALQPQISITPPVTPQQSSPDTLDTSEVASSVSSGSRLSKFVKRYKAGGKKNLSLPLHQQSSKTSGHGSESTERQDDDKGPLTPTDSGIGSSIVSG
ncbi:uncharacterized protein FSUBG_4631 [Fusarium subglutinans]|uniref:Fungal N-terminal domain-containing protein n=1 Tax=Gibberella subglutinans TaxID=42677 RepID=A0A8H5Q591_GIBSU|nr:uncharacterized protein FSUBG_4631 [Fusarium subglutinans]KAF5608413.1 hypothetical protein FSUBG_4631 [Fusarium subglutinans]